MDDVFVGFNDASQKVFLLPAGSRFVRRVPKWPADDFSEPVTLPQALFSFESMLLSAQKVAEAFEAGSPLDDRDEFAPIRNLFRWKATCRKYVKDNMIALLAARRETKTPADYAGTTSRSFCQQAVESCECLIRQLWVFVTDPKVPDEDQVQAASTRGDKINLKPIHADDLLTLVSSELALLQWNTIELSGGAAGVTSKADADEHIPDAEKLPFGLQRCDVPQTLKRDGFTKAVTIKNADHWKLMEALMTAFPNAVSEPKLKHIFQGPSDRDNYSRALKNSIDTLGLTIERWALTAMK